MMPFIDLLLDKSSRDISQGELFIGEHDLSISVLLTLSFHDIVLTGQTFADEMSCQTAEYAN
jgi:hypothetical protein